MDGNRFDSIAKAMAQGMSRRRALKRVAGAVVAAVVGSRGSEVVRAQNSCPPGQIPNRKGDCNCPAGTDACPDGCFNKKTDPNNCGGCGDICAAGRRCVKGECRCAAGLIDCGGSCVDIRSDDANCGGCGDTCPPGFTCGGSGLPGRCGCVPAICESLGTGCGTFEDGCGGWLQCTNCPPGQVCDGVACRLLDGAPCSSGTDCASGHCADGVCCDTDCEGQCEACDFSPAGTCAPFVGSPRGDRPACTGGPATVCSGFCDGINRETCIYAVSGTVCNAGICIDNVLDAGTFCDGAGSCAPSQGPAGDCSPYLCDPTLPSCPESCTSDGDCIDGFFCDSGQCSQSCLGLFETCENDAQCCSNDFAICEAIYPSPTTKCCSTLGGPCVFPLGDCCNVPGALDTSERRVFCAVAGSSTCGGVGAVCSSPTLPGDLEPSRQCVSGTCCLNAAGDAGVCCDFGQECDENLRCRTRN